MKINSINLIGEFSPKNRAIISRDQQQLENINKIAKKYKKEVKIAQKNKVLFLINSGAWTTSVNISELDKKSIYEVIISNLYKNMDRR